MVANRLRDAAAVLEVDSAYRRDAAIMREAADEVERLRHDIARHVAITCELATECESLRAELAECQLISARQFLDYGWHKDGCAFREDCDPCDCGFETLLRAALTANKQARKGGGGVMLPVGSNGGTCDPCGHGTIDRCPTCGAPQCCPRCCEESENERKANARKGEEQ